MYYLFCHKIIRSNTPRFVFISLGPQFIGSVFDDLLFSFCAFALRPSSSFQLSPDFRQRASSNASSCGRLSPIPSMITSEPDWGTEYTPAGDFTPSNEFSQADYIQAEQLAGSLADSMKLHGTDPFLNT